MNLKDRLSQDLKEAMKNKEGLKVSVIRMAKASTSLGISLFYCNLKDFLEI